MKEYKASDLRELIATMSLITASSGNAKPWWRGHSVYDWDLIPSLYRNGCSEKESNMNVRFRNMAKARHIKCPSNEDVLSWLFLMQHYKLPTRLLDWSESALVALYFVVESLLDDNTDGALWALNPCGLNKQQLGKENICVAGNGDIAPLFLEAFVVNKKNPNKKILSVLTDQTDIRHMVQQSAFTIHGDSVPINQLPNASLFLAKIIIPGTSKASFRHIMDLFGISRATLFPDLENLALELSSLNFYK